MCSKALSILTSILHAGEWSKMRKNTKVAPLLKIRGL
jgi:hypothetical protein